MIGRCGRCGLEWNNTGEAHCRACCESFSTDRLFDKHRVGNIDNRRCLTPAEMLAPHGKRKIPRFVQSGRGDRTLWRGAVLAIPLPHREDSVCVAQTVEEGR